MESQGSLGRKDIRYGFLGREKERASGGDRRANQKASPTQDRGMTGGDKARRILGVIAHRQYFVRPEPAGLRMSIEEFSALKASRPTGNF
jgi:hypothetical protein